MLVFPLSLLASEFAFAADDAKVKAGMEQVESGAKRIPRSKIGEGVEETAKSIGTTMSEGAKYSGEKLKEAGQAAELPAKTRAMSHFRQTRFDDPTAEPFAQRMRYL